MAASYGNGDDVQVSRSNNKAVRVASEHDNSPVTLPRSRLGRRQYERGWPCARGEVNGGPQRHGHISGEEVALEL